MIEVVDRRWSEWVRTTQLPHFTKKPNGDYIGFYGFDVLRSTVKFDRFVEIFTKGALRLEDVACDCPAPFKECQTLAQLREAVMAACEKKHREASPKQTERRNTNRWHVSLTEEQFRQLAQIYGPGHGNTPGRHSGFA